MTKDERAFNLKSIDILKLLCAILVVGIHTQPFAAVPLLDKAFGLVCKLAVPVFFTASGFFFFHGEQTWEKLRKYCVRILILYVVWSVPYIIRDLVTGSFVLNDFLISFFISGYRHFWYLYVSVWCVLICFLLLRLKRGTVILSFVSIVLFLADLFLFTYLPLFSGTIISVLHDSVSKIYTANSVLYGLIFVVLGLILARMKEYFTIKRSIVGLAASFVLLIVEGYVCIFLLHTQSTIVFIAVIPIVFFLFQLLLQLPCKITASTTWMRKVSTVIYCVHPLLLGALKILTGNNALLFVLLTAASFLFGWGLFMLQKKTGSKFLTKLM